MSKKSDASDIHKIRQLEEQVAELEARLREQERLVYLGTHVSELAHNLSSPLSLMLGYTQILNQKSPDRMTASLQRSAEKINNIVQLISKMSQPKSEQFDDDTSVEAIVVDEINIFQLDKFFANEVTTSTRIDTDARAQIAPLLLEQVINNLIKNAIDAVQQSEEKKIDIAVWQESGQVCIEIKDTGHGIAPENLNQVFERKFTTKSTGTGIGLSFCKRTVESSQGKVEIESEIDRGTKITITLPASKTKNQAA